MHDGRWPRLVERFGDFAVCAVVSTPFRGPDGLMGIINVYSAYGDLADQAGVESAKLLGAAVGQLLHRPRQRIGLESATLQLETALQSRATID